MIVQSPAPGTTSAARFVMKLDEHLQLASQFANAFGNDEFEAPVPRDEVLYVCRWHDRGWRDLDENPPLDRRTGLPYNLGETPVEISMLTSATSPHHNEAVHPYCGLLDSMHIYGLYNGRFGLSDWSGIDSVPAGNRPQVEMMLRLEHDRQERLLEQLGADPETAGWIEEDRLWANYKLLQLCDSLALYFQSTPEGMRRARTFRHVPVRPGEDADVTVTPLGEGRYSLDPYPFATSPLEIGFEGRYLEPYGPDEHPDMRSVMRDTPTERQTARLVAA